MLACNKFIFKAAALNYCVSGATTLSITTFNFKGLFVTLSIRDSQHT